MAGRPSRRGNRPRALDVSFGIEDPDDSATTSDASRKRERGDAGDADLRVRAWFFHPESPSPATLQGAKRRNLDAVPQPGEGPVHSNPSRESDLLYISTEIRTTAVRNL